MEEPPPDLFAAVVDRASVGLAVIEAPGRIVWANPAFFAATGRTPALLGQDLHALAEETGSLGPPVRAAIDAAILRGEAASFESVPARYREGPGGVYLDLEVRPLPGRDGTGARALLLVSDSTSRFREHERARLYYESYLSSANAIEITDRSGVIVDVNPAFERIYGFQRKELLGKRPNIVRSKGTALDFYQRMWADLLDPQKGHWSGELTNRDRFGNERPVFLTITAVRNEAGATTHYVGVAVDLAELKAWQRSASHADKLASVGQLAAGVAHEINTPLANVMLVTESILRRTGDPWIRSRVETIASQVDVAARIVRGLLDFARRNEPNVTDLDLTSVVRESVGFLKGKQSAEVEVSEIYPELPVMIRGDRGQLTQVMTNLLNNAYEAMEGTGRLRISVRSGDGAAEIEVRDSGPGIPEAVLPHIFEPFFTTKPEGRGTGLGLAICHGIVQAHEGSISAHNAAEGGAVFQVLLPLAPKRRRAE